MQSEGLRTEAWEAPARGAAHGTAASQHGCQAVTQRGRSRDGDGDGARGTTCDARQGFDCALFPVQSYKVRPLRAAARSTPERGEIGILVARCRSGIHDMVTARV